MLKGVLPLLLLELLDRQEDYGYAVVVRLQEAGLVDLAEGSVYPALTRLEARGSLASRLVPSDAGPARKYYRPTTEGLTEMRQARRRWSEFVDHVDRIINPDEGRAS